MSNNNNSKSVLVTGASGVLGRQVAVKFARAGWKVTGLAYSRATKNGLIKCDLNNFDEINKLIGDLKPDAIVHCAAERKPDAFEKDLNKSMNLNVDVTRNLAQTAAQTNIFFILISTDYVFDGQTPPYREDATPNPLQAYGKSKYEAELVTQQASPNHVILRVPLLYGEVETLDENAVTILFKAIQNTQTPVKMDDSQIRYPTYVGDVADVCLQLCDQHVKQHRKDKVRGIFHFSGTEKFTKYEIVERIASLFHLPIDHIERDRSATKSQVQRPDNAQLDSRKLSDLLDIRFDQAHFETTIKRCLESFIQ